MSPPALCCKIQRASLPVTLELPLTLVGRQGSSAVESLGGSCCGSLQTAAPHPCIYSSARIFLSDRIPPKPDPRWHRPRCPDTEASAWRNITGRFRASQEAVAGQQEDIRPPCARAGSHGVRNTGKSPLRLLPTRRPMAAAGAPLRLRCNRRGGGGILKSA